MKTLPSTPAAHAGKPMSSVPFPASTAMRNCIVLVAAGVAVFTAAGSSLFSTVGGQFSAVAEVPGHGSTNAFLPLTQPGPGSNQASYTPTVTSAVSYSFAETAGRSELDVPFTHNCFYALGGSWAFTYSDANFAGPAGTTYTIGGIFSVPPGQQTTDLYLDVNLIATPGGSVFHHGTVRSLPGGSSIVVGVPIPGDTLTGSPTGVLAAGVTYTLALNISTRNSSTTAVTSNGTISIVLAAPCYANCDGSTTPPVLNIVDFACFLNRYASGDSYANCDGSTTPPILNVLDFACFLNQFAAGCP